MVAAASVEQLDETEALGAAFTAARLTLLEAAIDLCATEGWKRAGARTLATWLAAYATVDLPEARRLARLAGLCHRHSQLRAAVLEGQLSFGRADLLAAHATGVREDHLDPSLPTLLRENRRLRRFDDWSSLLTHWCSYVDQELSLPPQAFRNELHLSQSIFGQGEIHGWLDPEVLVSVSAGIDAFLPGPDPKQGPVPPRTLAQRKADALGDMAARALTGEVGDEPACDGCGSAAADDARPAEDRSEPKPRPALKRRSGVTANVTIDLRTFAGDRRFDQLDGFDLRCDRWTIARSVAEQLLCDAGLVATLFDGRRTIIDASDRSEQFTPAQRRALAARDGGCVFPDCDRPAKFCDAHHLHHKSRGGTDRVGNACLDCRFHHRLLHRGWTIHFDERLDRWVATDPSGVEWHGRPRGSPGDN